MIMVRLAALKITPFLAARLTSRRWSGGFWHNSERLKEVEEWFRGWPVTT
jgi:hypothetical protein